jgi:hypothetical protein
MKQYSTGKSKWNHGQPTDYENGKPMHKLLGPCPICGVPTFDYGGGWRCNDPYCYNSYTNPIPNCGPAPVWWNIDINVCLDGKSWCATRDGFIDLQESTAGFGDSPQEAVDDLIKNEQQEGTHGQG